MNVDEFIDAVFTKYPPKVSAFKPIEDLYGEYRIGLKSENHYDYEAAFNDLRANYQYASTPYTATLKQYLKKHIIHDDNPLVLHLRRIKNAPKLDFDKQSAEYKANIKAKLAQIGIKSKIEALQ